MVNFSLKTYNSIRGVISTLVRDRNMSDDEVRDLINQVIEGSHRE